MPEGKHASNILYTQAALELLGWYLPVPEAPPPTSSDGGKKTLQYVQGARSQYFKAAKPGPKPNSIHTCSGLISLVFTEGRRGVQVVI